MTSQTKAVFFHTLEVAVAFSAPFLIAYLLKAGENQPILLAIGTVLAAVLKTLRDAGVLPDYISTAPTAAVPIK